MIKKVSKIFFLFVLLMFLFFQSSITQTQVQQLPLQQMMKASDVAKGAIIAPDYGKIPLYFVPNEGQVDEKALFLAKTSRYTLWVTKEGFIFDIVGKLKKKNNGNKFIDIKDRIKPKNIKSDRDISKLLFLNACKNPLVVPVDTTKHKVSFFIGNNESLWNTDIPTSKAVLYKDLYNNIDLKIYGVEKQIEYDFIVRPGGDVSDIKFEYKDVNQTRIDGDDNLIIETSFGELRHMKPLSYQLIEGNRVEVEARFKKVEKDTYGFEVEKYNLKYELVIDPLIYVYSTYLGGSDMDGANGIAVDKTGAVFVTGKTSSPDFPIRRAAYGSLSGRYCVFITKINPSGTALVYSTYLGGSGKDGAFDISVYKNGTVFVTGQTSSPDFPTKNPVYGSLSGNFDAFVTKIKPSGTVLAYSTYLGGSSLDWANSIAVDEKGAAYVAGSTGSRNFPTKNPIFGSFSGKSDAFITKLDIGYVIDAPTLISPKNGAVLDNGRSDGRDSIKWRFDWSDYPGATKYQLYVIHVGSKYPVINITVKRSSYNHVSKGYIIDRNRYNWIWKVRAGTKNSWLNWSEERGFTVEPLNTDPPSN